MAARNNMSADEYNEVCCSYAALMLSDDGVEITKERLDKAIRSSGNQVEALWPQMFANALEKTDINALLC